jgi:AcrR family transcriptional regulator
MGRKKQSVREDMLVSALQLFWERGFADTSMQELETVTGVNKAGIYAEFKSKLNLFLSALRFYLEKREGLGILVKNPLGLSNIRKFLEVGETCLEGQRGCFAVNSMRETHILPAEAVDIIEKSQSEIRQLIAANLRAVRPQGDVDALSDLAMTFFSGLCIEQNLPRDPKVTRRKVRRFIKVLEAI